METGVFFIVLFSAFLHAIWNSMASKYKDKNVSIGAIVYGHVPLCIVAIIFLPAPSIESFPYIILSALIHQGYQNFLLSAYQTGKFTTVYPVARGFGPLIATIISIIFLPPPLQPSHRPPFTLKEKRPGLYPRILLSASCVNRFRIS